MTKEELYSIQDKIGYSFKNLFLLRQAFIRRSYSQEHSEFENNEVLEFIGDSELDSFIVRKLVAEFSESDGNQFICRKNEGELTKFKSKYVNKKSLAHCIDALGFDAYLIMGKSDILNGAKNSDSVREDLLEAIVGAVAVDSSFDKEKINVVCEALLGYLDFSDDYISLVAAWCEENGWSEPCYISNSIRLVNGLHSCSVSISNKSSFNSPVRKTGEGKTPELAKMAAAKSLYIEHCKTEDMFLEIGEPDFDRAISQLHELAQKGFFDEPEYIFDKEYDEDGKPVWKCSCRIADYDEYYWAIAKSKKESRKKAAYSELRYVLGLSQDNSDEYEVDDDIDNED